MNDEYLWNKKGENAEIESLEQSLAAFRYRPDAPPAIPVLVAHREAVPRPWALWLKLSFGSAAAAACVSAAFVLWPGDAEQFHASSEPPAAAEIVMNDTVNTGALPEREKEKVKASPDISKSSARIHKAVHRAPAQKEQTKNFRRGAAELTKEEKYAYERLMLALSITGAKLKIVRDAIDGENSKEKSADTR